jgi:hypothetical protein
MRDVVYAIFTDEAKASRAILALDEAHFDEHEIGVLMHDGEDGTTPEELVVGVQTGIGRGALLGGVIGALTSTAFFAVLGVGVAPILILGTVAGGGLGATVGAFVGMGYWYDDIEFPEEPLEHGAILISVFTRNRINDAHSALLNAGAEEVKMLLAEPTATDEIAASPS